ncbi:MAG: NYN domain-containing protein [Anaerolineales bacterium]|nr:NYN domain-containing protein [Anaerolineales bacterium]
MPYLIDGHNLIGKIPGLQLDDVDDERELIERLLIYCQQTGKDAEIYFDRSATGHARASVHGRVTARFVRSGETADQAISRHLKRLGNAAANWTVVSSDRQVQNAAKRARARVIESEEFSRELAAGPAVDKNRESPPISEDEVDEWLDMFGAGDE